MNEFAVEYESFFIDSESEYDVFDFDTCFMDFIADVVSTCNTFFVSLDLKPPPYCLKYAFLGADKSIPVIITSDLD